MTQFAAGLLTFCALVAACGALLVALGLPLRWRFMPDRADPFLVQTAVLGGAVFSAFAWNWARFGTGGMHRGMPLLLAADAVALVAVGLRGGTLQAIRGRVRVPTVVRTVAPVLLVIVAVALLFALHFPGLFTHDDVVPLSGGNNDLPLYALNSEHLAHAGFDDPAHIGTYRLGKYAQKDVAGGFLFVAAAHAVTGVEEWRLVMPMLAFGVVLLVAALAELVRRCGVRSLWAGATIGLLAVASGTFFYNMVHGFVAYALTLGPMVLLLAVAIELSDDPSPGERRVLLLLGVATATWVYAVYPHVAFFFVPVLGAAVVVRRLGRSGSVREWVSTSVAALTATALSFVLPLVLIPDRVFLSVKRTFRLGGGNAGWSLGRVRLPQWLGVSRFPTEPTGHDPTVIHGGWLRFFTVLAVMALLAAVAVVIVAVFMRLMRPGEQRARWLTLLLLVALPIALYEVLFIRYGELYQAWKSATYLQPVVVAAILAIGWHLLRLATTRALVSGTAAMATALLFLLVIVASSRPYEARFGLQVTEGHRALAALPEQYRFDRVNFDLLVESGTVIWDSLWAMYFIQDAFVYPLSHAYAPVSKPKSPWTLRSPESPLPPGVTRHQLEGRFVLDFDPSF